MTSHHKPVTGAFGHLAIWHTSLSPIPLCLLPTNMALNWAMLAEDSRTPIPLPNEKSFFSQDHVRLELDCSAGGYPGSSGGTYISNKGILHLTNQRIVYISVPITEHFTSLSVPILNLTNGKFQQPWFGANYYEGTVTPVPGGGLTQSGHLKLIFKNGGGFDFSTMYSELLQRFGEIGETPQTFEALPAYTPPSSSSQQQPFHATGPSQVAVYPPPAGPPPPVREQPHYAPPSSPPPLEASSATTQNVRPYDMPPGYEDIVKEN